MLLLPLRLIMCSEITVPPVLLWQKVATLWVRVVDEGIIHVFVIGPNALPQTHLLDPVSVLEPRLYHII
jgi:hypothetical protein